MKLSFVKTVLTKDPGKAAEFIKRGGIVAFPTETVYGLGANVFDAEAISKVFEAKKRPADNPLIAHVSKIEQIGELTTQISQVAEKFIISFFPGPLTLVFPKRDTVPSIATAGLETIGVRMPADQFAHNFIQACGVPLVAPSANLSGRPSPTTWQAVLEDLEGRIDCILQGDPTDIGLESTVVDCSAEIPTLLRLGAISLESLQAIVPETRLAGDGIGAAAKSPGLRHQHYSPLAKVVLKDPKFEILDLSSTGYIGLRSSISRMEFEHACASIEDYARSLFEFFRECDRRGIETIYCEAVEETGIGAALMDRIRRAAAR